MEKKRKIAISQRIDYIKDREEHRDSLDQRLIEFIDSLNLTPLLIPNSLVNSGERLEGWLNSIKPNGILFSGGNNIGDFSSRDKTEKKIYQWAIERSIPLFGICQINGVNLKYVSNHVSVNHKINLSNHNQLITRKSFHEFAIQDCPNDFKITHYTSDGIIEGIEHYSKNIKAIMWHPEREDIFFEYDKEMIKNFYEQS
jgi:putative glutamine amidotransferase